MDMVFIVQHLFGVLGLKSRQRQTSLCDYFAPAITGGGRPQVYLGIHIHGIIITM